MRGVTIPQLFRQGPVRYTMLQHAAVAIEGGVDKWIEVLACCIFTGFTALEGANLSIRQAIQQNPRTPCSRMQS